MTLRSSVSTFSADWEAVEEPAAGVADDMAEDGDKEGRIYTEARCLYDPLMSRIGTKCGVLKIGDGGRGRVVDEVETRQGYTPAEQDLFGNYHDFNIICPSGHLHWLLLPFPNTNSYKSWEADR